MLALDSLVIDLIFEANAELDPHALVTALGGEEVAGARMILDPDQQPPEFEMQLSPSVPLRRQGERRLMILDDSVAPMREDPRQDPVVPIDLRPEKERLVAACRAMPVRIGRLSALGSWGDAVMVAPRAEDLRAVALLSWALDPTVDIDGRARSAPLSEAEVKEKLLAFDSRLQELGEQDILADIGPAALERRDDLLVLDVLEPDGTWDVRKSQEMEEALAALSRFATFPGAPASGRRDGPARAEPAREEPRAKPPAEETPAEPAGPALRVAEVGDRVVLVFPRERFSLDAAAAMGTGNWDAVLAPVDPLGRDARDRIEQRGAGFVAPLEFLSEVFVDGKPLSRPQFDQGARELPGGARALEVHCPRFGPAVLVDVPERGRFISSEVGRVEDILALVAP